MKHPNLAVQEHLEERVKDMSELGDIRSLDIAMAIAAGEILEFEKWVDKTFLVPFTNVNTIGLMEVKIMKM